MNVPLYCVMMQIDGRWEITCMGSNAVITPLKSAAISHFNYMRTNWPEETFKLCVITETSEKE